MHRSICLSLSFLVCLAGGHAFAAPVAFNDPDLEAYIEDALGLTVNVDGFIDSDDLDGTSGAGQMGPNSGLVAVWGPFGEGGPEPLPDIDDLTGLEACTNLSAIVIGGSDIADWSPIVGLPFPQLPGLLPIPVALFGAVNCGLDDADVSQIFVGQPALSNVNLLIVANMMGPTNANNLTDTAMAVFGGMSLAGLMISGNPGVTSLAALSPQPFMGAAFADFNDCSISAGLSAINSWGAAGRVNLANNNISSLTGLDLSGLSGLEELDLSGNSIVSVSPLTTFAGSSSGQLILTDNQISNLTPLVLLAGAINRIDVSGNPLDTDSCCVDIPALQNGGTQVETGGACANATFNVTITIVGLGTVTLNGNPVTSGVPVAVSCGSNAFLGAQSGPFGYSFASYSGDLTNTNSFTNFTVDGDKAITATFSQPAGPKVNLTIEVEGDGTTDPAPGTYQVTKDTFVNTPQPLPDSGYVFAGWTGDLTSSVPVAGLYMDTDKVITCNFATPRPVRVEIVIVGDGTSDPPPGVYFDYMLGDTLHVEATPAGGVWEFHEFVVDTQGVFGSPANVLDLLLTGDTLLYVRFRENAGEVRTIYLDVIGGGTTMPPPGAYQVTFGDLLRIAAVDRTGWRFDQWLSRDIGPAPGEPPRTNRNEVIIADYTKVITARFVSDPSYTLPVGGIATLIGLSAVMAAGGGFVIVRRRRK